MLGTAASYVAAEGSSHFIPAVMCDMCVRRLDSEVGSRSGMAAISPVMSGFVYDFPPGTLQGGLAIVSRPPAPAVIGTRLAGRNGDARGERGRQGSNRRVKRHSGTIRLE